MIFDCQARIFLSHLRRYYIVQEGISRSGDEVYRASAHVTPVNDSARILNTYSVVVHE